MTPAIGKFSIAHRQRGVALIVVLILLLIMTLLGLASLRGTMMEERMGSNLYDRSLSFQAAEAALREGERLASTSTPTDFAGAGSCLAARCGVLPDAAATLLSGGGVAATTSFTATGAAPTATPRYLVEYMGVAPNWAGCDQERPISPTCKSPRYRITASSDATDRSQVVLQSNFAAP